jgi:hypothetical protein
MALLQFIFDTSTRRKYGVPYPGFIDETFIIAGSEKSQFDLSTDIDADHAIDVEVDGRGQLEDTHWTRDTTNNRVNTDSAVNVGSWVRVRIYRK